MEDMLDMVDMLDMLLRLAMLGMGNILGGTVPVIGWYRREGWYAGEESRREEGRLKLACWVWMEDGE